MIADKTILISISQFVSLCVKPLIVTEFLISDGIEFQITDPEYDTEFSLNTICFGLGIQKQAGFLQQRIPKVLMTSKRNKIVHLFSRYVY